MSAEERMCHCTDPSECLPCCISKLYGQIDNGTYDYTPRLEPEKPEEEPTLERKEHQQFLDVLGARYNEPWTLEETEIVKFLRDNREQPWVSVAGAMDGRSAVSCQAHIERLQRREECKAATNEKIGMTPAEEIRLLYGKPDDKIPARASGTKTEHTHQGIYFADK